MPMALVTALVACQNTNKTQPAKGATADAGAAKTAQTDAGQRPDPNAGQTGDKPQSDDPVIGAVEGYSQVRLSDYDRAIKRFALFAPDDKTRAMPDDFIKAPHFQQRTVINLVDMDLMRHMAKDKGITISQQEIDAAIAAEPRLKRFAALTPDKRAALLKEFGLEPSDLDTVVRDRLLAQKLPPLLIPDPTPDQLWQAYKIYKERVEIEYIKVPNTPVSADIDAFEAKNGPQIEGYYTKNKDEFSVPASRKVRLIQINVPKDATEDARQAARRKLEAFKRDVEAGQDFAELARTHSQHTTAKQGGDLGYVVRRQRPEAFKTPVGQITDPLDGPGGVYILQIESELPAHTQDLTGSIRREIAAKLLRKQGPQPKAMATADQLALHWRRTKDSGDDTSLQLALKQHHLRIGKTFPFQPDARADLFIPGIGQAPDVMKAVRKLNPEAPISAAPVLYRDQLYVLALKHQGKASRTEFAAEKDAFATHWLRERRSRAVTERTNALKETHGIQIDMRPVRNRYGVIDRKPQ